MSRRRRWVLLNTHTLYPVHQLAGDPVADPNKQGAVTLQADDAETAALAMLEAQGFTVHPCCTEEGELCAQCQADDELEDEDRADDARLEQDPREYEHEQHLEREQRRFEAEEPDYDAPDEREVYETTYEANRRGE